MRSQLPVLASLALAAFGCGEDARSLGWEIVFEDPSVAARARWVEGRIVEGGCAGTNVLYREGARPGEMPAPPPAVGPGRYGFAGRALDGSCVPLADGCTEVDLPEDQGAIVTVTLVEVVGSAECGPSECIDGVCGGTMDAGGRDGGPAIDGGPPIDGGPTPDGGGRDGGPPIDGGGRDAGMPDAGVVCGAVDEVAVGSFFACAITAGELWCWGDNVAGQLGNGTSGIGTGELSPIRVGTRTDWVAVGAGDEHVCAITTAGALWCWGDNEDGQIGTGDMISRSSPFMVAASGHARVRGSSGGDHTCMLPPSDVLSCMGQNNYGQLGVMDLLDRTAPTAVMGTFAAFSLGHHHTCGVRGGGALFCWGENTNGQLGLGTSGATTHQNAPVRVGTLFGWTATGLGDSHSCAINAGELHCWGAGGSGRLGTGSATMATAPVRIGTATSWVDVDGGLVHTCAIRTDGSIWCFGSNAEGQLGTGTGMWWDVPVRVVDVDDAEEIHVGVRYSCALRMGGELACWGDNSAGQLGQGDLTNRNRPTPVCIPE